MLAASEALKILDEAEEIYSAGEVTSAIEQLAKSITARLQHEYPLVLSVMGGAVVFSGLLLPLLHFPLEFDAIHVSRYGDAITGGRIAWRVLPKENIVGRTILVLDDILDEGFTLDAIREKLLELGAASVLNAVLVEKQIDRPKPIRAEFVGLTVPNRYVFGCGMDVHGAWRNLPAIYALARGKEGKAKSET